MSDSKTNKKGFKYKKDCAICSLKEVERFLHNLDKASASIKVFKNLR